MPVKITVEEKRIIAMLSGEIDHHTAKLIRTEIDYAIRENSVQELILDFSDVGFMDSSGIGLVMGRCKLMRETGGEVVVRNPISHIRKVMRLSGIDRIASISVSKEGVCRK